MNTDSKTLKCLAVDDEPHALRLLGMYIEKIPFLELSQSTTSPWEALEFLKSGSIDLLFLDIQMEGLTGLQLLDVAGKTCPVILTTAYSEYALEGYEYQVADYLLKPFSFERFLKAVTPIFHNREDRVPLEPQTKNQKTSNDYLFVKGDAKNKYHRVELKTIQYIEGLRNYVQFVCNNQKVITLQNLKSLEEELPADRFIRIHKSFIINFDHITEIDGNSLLIGGNRFPIGSSYRERFFERIRKK